MDKRPETWRFRGVSPTRLGVYAPSLLVHPTHAAAAGHRRSLFLFLLLHHDALGREEQAAMDAAFCNAVRVTLSGR